MRVDQNRGTILIHIATRGQIGLPCCNKNTSVNVGFCQIVKSVPWRSQPLGLNLNRDLNIYIYIYICQYGRAAHPTGHVDYVFSTCWDSSWDKRKTKMGDGRWFPSRLSCSLSAKTYQKEPSLGCQTKHMDEENIWMFPKCFFPSHHPFLDGIFHEIKPSSCWDTSIN